MAGTNNFPRSTDDIIVQLVTRSVQATNDTRISATRERVHTKVESCSNALGSVFIVGGRRKPGRQGCHRADMAREVRTRSKHVFPPLMSQTVEISMEILPPRSLYVCHVHRASRAYFLMPSSGRRWLWKLPRSSRWRMSCSLSCLCKDKRYSAVREEPRC